MSTNSVDPSVLFGGTWEQISGQFLLGAGEEYPLGGTGGEATHALSVQEMPTHSHIFSGITTNSSTENIRHTHTITINDGGSHQHAGPNLSDFYTTRGTGTSKISGIEEGRKFNDKDSHGGVKTKGATESAGSHTHSVVCGSNTGSHIHSITPQGDIGNTGGSGAHNNMPPYLAVNIWQRTPKFDFLQNLCYNIIKKKNKEADV